MKKKERKRSSREEKETQYSRNNPKIIEIILAKERTALSNKRLQLSFININLALIVLGIAMIRMFENSDFRLLIYLGPILVICGIIFSYNPIKKIKKFNRRLESIRQQRGKLDKLYFIEEIVEEKK